MTLISSETRRETSIRSLASILFKKSELPWRALGAPRIILNFYEISSKLHLYVSKICLFFIEMNYVIYVNVYVSLVYKHFALC